MIFTSIYYLLFLPLVVFLYYLVPHKYRWAILLAASLFFYASFSVWMLPWLIFAILISFGSGLLIEYGNNFPETGSARRRLGIVLGTVPLIASLFLFKYLNFFIDQIGTLGSLLGISCQMPRVDWITPVGISFIVFQTLGYLFDVYTGKSKASKHLGKYALFIAFFPHLAQGPIERSDTLLPQIDEKHTFEYDSARRALVLIFFGVFKKVVVANRLTVLVDTVFSDVASYTGLSCWVAALFYSFQIYCDFSGYTDIALGSAALMGFRLKENFRMPYLATSISDFWRRWHISLSNWFRDYIYIPLGGNRVSEFRWALNVLIVFLVSGIWHGAAWTFILWGALHGLFQIIGKYKFKLTSKLIKSDSVFIKPLRILMTFSLVTILWILFRASSVSDFFVMIKGMFTFAPGSDLLALGMNKNELLLSFVLILFMILFDLMQSKFDVIDAVERLPLPFRWTIYLIFLFAIIMFGRYGNLSASSFIYFQF